jgi:hypothetical protein
MGISLPATKRESIMHIRKTNYRVNATSYFELLTKEEIGSIINAALTTLKKLCASKS